MLPPFNFSEPLFYVVDNNEDLLARTSPSGSVKIMGLWRMDGKDLVGRGTGKGFRIDIEKAHRIVTMNEGEKRSPKE